MKTQHILCLILMTVLLLTNSITFWVHGVSPIVLKIVPPPTAVKEGRDFTVSIEIYNVVDLVAFQLELSWDTEFLNYVLHTTFPPWPPPVSVPPAIIDESEGYIVIGAAALGTNTFTGNTTLATITFQAVKPGMTQLSISEAFITQDTPIPPPIEIQDALITILPSYTWIRTTGAVSNYGSDPASGLISILAILENWAGGWCFFATPPLGPEILIFPPPAFNFTLYIARIINASVVKLHHNASDLWISAFWQVNSVENPSTIIDIVKLVDNMTVAAGELRVAGGWDYFIIEIEGFESIQGDIVSYYVRSVDEIDDKIPYCDLNGDYKIDMRDIGIVARAFGSFLGFDRYEFYADINFDLRINMRDVGACARSFGKQY